MDESWEITVKAARGVAGGATLLTCVTSPAARAHVSVTRWFKDGVVLTPIAVEAAGAVRLKTSGTNRLPMTARLSLRLLIRRLDSGNSINHPPPPAETQPILMTN
ncbi:hypothetical protein ACJJTC_006664 [Scirpophaga incertulas]